MGSFHADRSKRGIQIDTSLKSPDILAHLQMIQDVITRMARCSLIGSETVNRPYVQYEIEQSWNNKMGLVGIHINALHGQDRKGKVDWGVENYLLKFCNKINIHKPTSQPEIRNNIGDWIEKAAQDAGR